jgi:rhomboid protease GluP
VTDQQHLTETPSEEDSQTVTPLHDYIESISDPTAHEPRPPQVRVRLPDIRPVITYAIMGVTILVFLLQLMDYNVTNYGMKDNDLILNGEYWRFLTPLFLHGNILHIAFNMYALRAFGPSLERFYGHRKFLLLYLVCGFSGVVASFVLTSAASLGASTAIFGLLGAQGVFAYQNQKVFGEQARRVLGSIINIGLINILFGILAPGIDNWGHIGGLIGGLVIAWFGGPIFRLAGNPPEMHLENQRGDREFNLAVLGTGLVFGSIVVGVFLQAF